MQLIKQLSLLLSFFFTCFIIPFTSLQALPMPSIQGTVTDAVSGKVIVGAGVTIEGLEGKKSTTTNANGFYSFIDITPGNYNVVVNSSSHALKSSSVFVKPGETKQVDFALHPSVGEIFGVVVRDDLKTPLSEAVIDILFQGSLFATTHTDSAGFYSVAVVAGTYSVRATANTFQTITAHDVNVRKDQPSEQNFSLKPSSGTIIGTVKNGAKNMEPINGARVEALIGTEIIASVQSDAKGNYTLSGLIEETFTVRASARDPVTPDVCIDVQKTVVKPNKTSTADFVLKGNPVSISGNVRRVDSKKPIQARIEVFNQKGLLMASTLADAAGGFTLPGFAEGTYDVIFSSPPRYKTLTNKGVVVKGPVKLKVFLERDKDNKSEGDKSS